MLRDLKAESEFDLLGLFQGVGLAHGEELAHTGVLPNMVFLYRRPILEINAGHALIQALAETAKKNGASLELGDASGLLLDLARVMS